MAFEYFIRDAYCTVRQRASNYDIVKELLSRSREIGRISSVFGIATIVFILLCHKKFSRLARSSILRTDRRPCKALALAAPPRVLRTSMQRGRRQIEKILIKQDKS